MEKISKHLIESTIWSIGYFGTKDIPKLWIELRSPTKTQWVSFDISKRMASDICSFDPSNKIKTWLKGVGNIGLFLRLKSGVNPGIEALEAYDLATGNLIYDVNITHWVKLTHSHIQVVQEKALYLRNSSDLSAIFSLGKIAFDACLNFYMQDYNLKRKDFVFQHGTEYILPDDKILIGSYHPSPRNVNTGRIDENKMGRLLKKVKKVMGR